MNAWAVVGIAGIVSMLVLCVILVVGLFRKQSAEEADE
jgi:hypothetical protein